MGSQTVKIICPEQCSFMGGANGQVITETIR